MTEDELKEAILQLIKTNGPAISQLLVTGQMDAKMQEFRTDMAAQMETKMQELRTDMATQMETKGRESSIDMAAHIESKMQELDTHVANLASRVNSLEAAFENSGLNLIIETFFMSQCHD